MRLLIIAAFVFCGGMTYLVSHWLIQNDAAYKRLFWSPFRFVALTADLIDKIGVYSLLTTGLFLGLCIVAVHARRWLLFPVALLLLGLAVMVLLAL